MWFYPPCRAPLLMGINGKSLEFMFLFILNALSPQTLKPQSLLGTRSSVVFFLPPEIPIHSHFLCLLPLQLLLHPLLFHFSCPPSSARQAPSHLHPSFLPDVSLPGYPTVPPGQCTCQFRLGHRSQTDQQSNRAHRRVWLAIMGHSHTVVYKTSRTNMYKSSECM